MEWYLEFLLHVYYIYLSFRVVPTKLQVKISTQHPEVLAAACEHFLSKKQREIESLVTETLEGHQRGIMGTMTVEVYSNMYVSRLNLATSLGLQCRTHV